MNEFERQLGKQPWREVPPAWRDEILRQPSRAKDYSTNVWREVLWPSPAIWGAMAAVWLVFISVDPLATAIPETRHEVRAGGSPLGGSPLQPATFHLTSTDNPLIASLR